MMHLKKDIHPEDLLYLTPEMRHLLLMTYFYFKARDMKFVITSLNKDRKNVKSISRTHQEGRGVDIRSAHLSQEQIKNTVEYLNAEFREIAAISSKDRKPRAALYHNNHIHLQVKRVKDGFFQKYLNKILAIF